MTQRLGRRRFLSVSAACCALAATGARAGTPVARWQGTALGARASLQLAGIGAEDAAPVFTAVQQELRRLEEIFSLYRPASEICRLNRDGMLQLPSPDLLSVLGTCAMLHAKTEGAFDPTVQPVFLRSAEAATHARAVSDEELDRVLPAVGWENVRVGAGEIRLLRAGAALTLNGIAQGYVTDRIAMLLRQRGLTDILVDMGEVTALGHRAGGTGWRAGIAAPGGAILRRLVLADRALATSAPKGTLLDAAGRLGHIFDPATGREAQGCSVVSVSAPDATLADGASTALCVLPRHRHAGVLARLPGCRIELTV